MGCVGYYNYRFFILFAFWAGVWASMNQIVIFFNKRHIQFDTYDMTYYLCNYLFIGFAWFMFFFYGFLALKGLTVIEASERYAARRDQPLVNKGLRRKMQMQGEELG